MKFRISHTTTYHYSQPVNLSQNHARLSPINTQKQTCLYHTIDIFPASGFQQEFIDNFDNKVTMFELFTAHSEMKVISISEIEINPNQIDIGLQTSMPWQQVKALLLKPSNTACINAAIYTLPTALTQFTPSIKKYALASFNATRPIFDACTELMERIYSDFIFDPSFSTISTPITTVFEHRRGVCQDFAHLTLACIRSLGLAAKYVSGYIETIPPPGQEKLEGADATHAWVSVFMPDLGWVDFDPTNNLIPSNQHVTVATGRDFADITPIKGVVYGGGTQTLDVAVDMKRLENAL